MENVTEDEELFQFTRQMIHSDTNAMHIWTGSFFELPVQYFFVNATDLDTMQFSKNNCAVSPKTEISTLLEQMQSNDSNEELENLGIVCGLNDPALNRDIRSSLLETFSIRKLRVLRIHYKDSPPGFTKLLFSEGGRKRIFRRQNLRIDSTPGAGWSRDLITTKQVPQEFLDGIKKLNECTIKQSAEKSSAFSDQLHVTMDWVDSIKCPIWPDEADEWRNRKRPSGWPSAELVETITLRGCRLVAKPHNLDPNQDDEWRFSFSEAELILAHGWSDAQKYIYHVLRVIKSEVVNQCGGKDNTFLCTYYFKTLMLWACEEKPKEFWAQTKVEEVVTELLCKMIEWLSNQEIWNYFIPSHNLLSHVLADRDFDTVIQHLVDAIERIDFYIDKAGPISRQDPNKESLILASVPNKLFLTVLLRFPRSFMTNPFVPGIRKLMADFNLKTANAFLEKTRNLFQAISLHRRLVSQDHKEEVRIALIEDIKEKFKNCRESEVKGVTEVEMSTTDTAYDIVYKVLKTPYGNRIHSLNQFPEAQSSPANICVSSSSPAEMPSQCNKDTANFSTGTAHRCDIDDDGAGSKQIVENSQEKPAVLSPNIPAYSDFSLVKGLREIVLHALLKQYNDEIPDPYSLIQAAYEANFLYTVFPDCLVSLNKAKDMSNEWLQRIGKIVQGFTHWIAVSDELLLLVLTQRWIQIFDHHIQVIFGFLNLCADMIKSRLRSSTVDETRSPPSLCIHVNAMNFLSYVIIQCKRRLASLQNIALNDEQDESDIRHLKQCTRSNASSCILYAALRISRVKVKY